MGLSPRKVWFNKLQKWNRSSRSNRLIRFDPGTRKDSPIQRIRRFRLAPSAGTAFYFYVTAGSRETTGSAVTPIGSRFPADA